MESGPTSSSRTDAPGGHGDRLEIGRVARPHGLRGEVFVDPITNRPERFERGAVHYAGDRTLVVARARSQKRRWVVAYEGVSDLEGAEALRAAVLTGDPIDVLGQGEMWVHELIGSSVVDDEGVARGRVIDVEANPAHDILVLDSGVLIPVVFVSEFAGGRVVVSAPAGLFDDDLVDGNRAAVERRRPSRKRTPS